MRNDETRSQHCPKLGKPRGSVQCSLCNDEAIQQGWQDVKSCGWWASNKIAQDELVMTVGTTNTCPAELTWKPILTSYRSWKTIRFLLWCPVRALLGAKCQTSRAIRWAMGRTASFSLLTNQIHTNVVVRSFRGLFWFIPLIFIQLSLFENLPPDSRWFVFQI